jgi:hypothetical protein
MTRNRSARIACVAIGASIDGGWPRGLDRTPVESASSRGRGRCRSMGTAAVRLKRKRTQTTCNARSVCRSELLLTAKRGQERGRGGWR